MDKSESANVPGAGEPERASDSPDKPRDQETPATEAEVKQSDKGTPDPAGQLAAELGSPSKGASAPKTCEPSGSSAQSLVLDPVEVKQNSDVKTTVVLFAGSGLEIRPKFSTYSIDGKYLKPVTINKWVMVILFDKQAVQDMAGGVYTFDDLKAFAERYVQAGRYKGVEITPMDSIQCIPAEATVDWNIDTMPAGEMKQALRQLFITLNESQVEHAIIVLPETLPDWAHSYLQYLETIKLKPDSANKIMKTSRMRLKTLVQLGIKSRCGGKQALLPNVWLKYNTKLGGINLALKRTFETHAMKFLNEDHLILAIDLAQHDRLMRPPLVAVVLGMWNLTGAQMSYHTETRVQARDPTLADDALPVADIGPMAREVLRAYKQTKDNQLPRGITVFRVGAYKRSDMDFALQEVIGLKGALKDEQPEGQLAETTTLTYLKIPKRGKVRKWVDSDKKSGMFTSRVTSRPQAARSGPVSADTVSSGAASSSSGAAPSSPSAPPSSPGEPSGSPKTLMGSPRPPTESPKTPTGSPRAPSGSPGTPSSSPSAPSGSAGAPSGSVGSPRELKRPRDPNNKPHSQVYKLYDEARLSDADIQSMIFLLSHLSPRVTARTRPTPVDLADLAGERTFNLVNAWMDENQHEFGGDAADQSKLIEKINEFLINMGDSDYKRHLYYA